MNERKYYQVSTPYDCDGISVERHGEGVRIKQGYDSIEIPNLFTAADLVLALNAAIGVIE